MVLLGTGNMNNKEIARRIRKILYNANSVANNDRGGLDFATNHCYMIESLTELLLDILNAPEI